MRQRLQLSVCVFLALGAALGARAEKPDVIVGAVLQKWKFDSGLTGWEAVHDCKISAVDGAMKIVSSSNDPYLTVRLDAKGPGLVIKLRARSNAAGTGQFFWSTDKQGGFVEARSKRFEMIHDGKWHEYSVLIGVKGTVKALRFDPAVAAGVIEVDSMAIHHGRIHPLKTERIETLKDRVVFHVRNTSEDPVSFVHSEETHTIPGGKTITVTRKLHGKRAFERCDMLLTFKNLPKIRRSVLVFRPEIDKDSNFLATVGTGDLKLRIPHYGNGARIEYKGKLVGFLGPIAQIGGRAHSFLFPDGATNKLRMACRGVVVNLVVKDNEIGISINIDERHKESVEGPALRAIGTLQQGLFAGLEYLGKGEKSSSKLDIETDAHMRMSPDPALVTMPLMSCVTDRATLAMTWSDMKLKPVFSSPNAIDAAADHRMALRGRRIEATILVSDATLEDTILWAVKKAGGLPAPPKAPLSDKAQLELDMRAINGPISGPGGWGHCAEAKWKRHYFADIASTIWRMTGKAPKIGQLVGGGAHVKNHAIYFVTGQAKQWLAIRRRQAKATIAAQKPDGSFRYSGKYLKGHFEDTSSGYCALRAMGLLEMANFTGDPDAKQAGLKALEYMKRFRTPRGAQTWELSLHTPDILAAGNLVRAYVYGYELTGRKEYLALARKWAISGIPFVYLWSNQPIMTYATVPVYGATNFRAPLWIGLPVQWCGGVYAYGLTELARHDKSLDWNHLARGILIAGRQMQYPDGPLAGCLPDIFQLASQKRAGPSINPCALISLQLALEGKVDSLAVAASASHRVVAPFPVTIAKGKARIQGRKGLTYQAIVDGKRIVTIESKGVDEIDLNASRP
jgi:hypothetical protein